MSVIQDIEARLKEAMKAKDAEALSALRMLRAAVQNATIEKRKPELDDEEVLEVAGRELKKLKDSLEDFIRAGREDLAEKARKEIALLEGFMPEQLSEEALRQAVRKAVDAVGASGSADFGKVMGAVMKDVKGKADGKEVTRIVKEILSST